MPSLWRTAAAACLLSVGLMAISGPAVAVAEIGSASGSGSAPGSASGSGDTTHGTESAAATSTARGNAALRAKLRDVASTLGVGHPGRSRTQTDELDSTSVAAKKPLTLDPFAATAHITRTVTGVLSPRPKPAGPPSDSAGPPPTGGLDSGPAGPTPLPPTPPTPPADPVTGTFAAADTEPALPPDPTPPDLPVPLADQFDEVSRALVAPIPDVLAAIQDMLTSTSGAMQSVVALPMDVASLFGYAPGSAAAIGRADGRTPAGATRPTPLGGAGILTGSVGVASVGDATTTSTAPVGTASMAGTTTALADASPVTMGARGPADAALPEALTEFLHGYGVLIIAASLSALAFAALPGILGFLVPTAAGVGLGYRQAQAGTALRASGLARFATGGPVGIVRSGSLVSLRPRVSPAAPQVTDFQQVA